MPTSSPPGRDDDFGTVSYSNPAQPSYPNPGYSNPVYPNSSYPNPARPVGSFYDRYDQPAESEWGDTHVSGQAASATAQSYSAPTTSQFNTEQSRRRGRNERGLPAVVALLVFLVICGIGGSVDLASGAQVKGGFNVALVIGALAGILLVRRSSMFPIVVAPPIVYLVASAALLYVRSHGLKDRSVLLNAGVNWLVYGFPAIAGATAAVLIVAGVRTIARK